MYMWTSIHVCIYLWKHSTNRTETLTEISSRNNSNGSWHKVRDRVSRKAYTNWSTSSWKYPESVHSVLQYARSCAISALTFHSVHVAPKKDRSFRFPCRKTNSSSRQGAQPTLSPTAWRINARSLYEVDGVRVERIARKRRRQDAREQEGETRPFSIRT